MTAADHVSGAGDVQVGPQDGRGVVMLVRLFGWCTLAALVVFLLNNYLSNWRGWPGPAAVFTSADGLAVDPVVWLQAVAYPLAFVLAALYVLKTRERDLRDDSVRISNVNAVIIRMAFFVVLYIGIADAAISFLRVEGLLPALFGEPLATNLGISEFRGTYVHIPLIVAGIVTGTFTRTFGFHWLALLAVAAELVIVITRFVFSYEQAFMADLVRFWYAALFLFASAHTLLEEGHVRVDVLYSTFGPKAKGRVNAIGSVVLGIALCWVVLAVGMYGKSAVINSPLLAFETTQTGFGMYVKYLMAGFLALFAISMMIQFVSYLMDAVADWRGDPGGRDHDVHAVQ